MYIPWILTLLSLLTISHSSALPRTIQQRSVSSGPVITQNFPDPSIIHTDGKWYSFATNSGNEPGKYHVQVASSPDFEHWTYLEKDALPTVGKWSNGMNVWAPDVIQVENNFVMYYSANTADGATHCVGIATSKNIEGPYKPKAGAIACPRDQGGAIDPAGFRDPDTGTLYLTYKIDGNSLGHGGNCNNGVEPLVTTPVMLQRLEADGITAACAPTQILDRGAADGPLVEAPSLMKKGGIYFLFFSSNCYDGPFYNVAYATASSVTGPYTKANASLLVTGSGPDGNLYAPGGASVTPGGDRIVFHADFNKTSEVRQMWTAEITISGSIISV